MDNITVDNIGSFFSGFSLAGFFIKSFSVVFSLLFLTYAIISYKQVQEIARAVLNKRNRFIVFFSLLQVFIGIFMLIFAITVV